MRDPWGVNAIADSSASPLSSRDGRERVFRQLGYAVPAAQVGRALPLREQVLLGPLDLVPKCLCRVDGPVRVPKKLASHDD
jgi:hypothetical protein